MALRTIQLPKVGERAFDVWNYRYIWERRTIINNEKQMYMHPMDDPLEINDVLPAGGKKLIAMQSSKRVVDVYGKPYQSALITTHKKLAYRYGRIDFWVTLPSLKGLWSALWMLGEYQQWPDGKPILPEIDIVEYLGDNVIHNTIHYYINNVLHGSHKNAEGGPTGVGKTKLGDAEVSGVLQASLDWDDGYMTFLINDVPVFKVATPVDMKNHFHILMNIACGGDWPDAAGFNINNAMLPNAMEVHKVTITSDDFLYDLPNSVHVLNSAEHIPPTLNNRVSAEPPQSSMEVEQPTRVVGVDTSSPVSQETKDYAQRVIAEAETQAPVGAEKSRKHIRLTTHLLKTGWYIHHNKKYTREIVLHYLTGEKTHPVLDSPTFTETDENISIAWGGVIHALQMVASGSTDTPNNADGLNFLTPSPETIDAANKARAALANFVNRTKGS